MALRGETGWQAFHCKAFGKERWLKLCKALKAKVTHVILVNPFLQQESQLQYQAENSLQKHADIPLVYMPDTSKAASAQSTHGDETDDKFAAAASQLDMEPLSLKSYFMDGASTLAALALGAEPGEKVLDLCAAPGGKSLILATQLFTANMPRQVGLDASSATTGDAQMIPKKGLLVCNEASRPRAERLRHVLSSFLPQELVAAGGQVHITVEDATAGLATKSVPIYRLGPYDRILLDAPCTSDRHLAHQGSSALAKWAAGGVKASAERQLELLRNAAALVKQGGVILYCTCALAEQENDGVVAKFLKKPGQGSFQPEWPSFWGAERIQSLASADAPPVASVDGIPERAVAPTKDGLLEKFAGAETTAYGVQFLPDRTPYGPMYFACLRRL